MKPYYEDGTVTIYHGDSRDIAPDLASESIDLLLTDPPYGMAFVSGWTLEKATVRSDGVRQGIRVARSVLNALEPSYAPGMHALVFCHWESWPDFYDNLCHLFQIRNALIWSKTGGGMGDLRHEYAKDYEVILFGARSREREISGKRIGAVLEHKRVPSAARFVPFQKPVGLLRSFVDRHCPPGGLVLDPFMGSGSSLIAAKQQGRSAIGIELEERLCEVAVERLSQQMLEVA